LDHNNKKRTNLIHIEPNRIVIISRDRCAKGKRVIGLQEKVEECVENRLIACTGAKGGGKASRD
jgi:hypothetical protein